jgi:fumarylacetoacetase
MLKNFSRPALKLYKYEAHLLGPFRTLATHAKMSWLPISEDSPFSIHNLPFGIITSKSSQTQKRPAVAIGDHVLDLLAFSKGDGFVQLPSIQPHLEVFAQPTLNAFAALGRETHRAVRGYLHEIFTENTEFGKVLKDNEELRKQALLPKHETKTHLPMQIGDYTDFYAGLNHAFNVG